MNPAPCGAKGGECPGEKSPKHLLASGDYRKPGGSILASFFFYIDALQVHVLTHVVTTEGDNDCDIFYKVIPMFFIFFKASPW